MFIGKPKRDAAGTLLSAGDDLNQPGLTEYAFDVIYVTCMTTPCMPSGILLDLQGHVKSDQAYSAIDSGGSTVW
jgi:hypothetical protein